MSRSHASQTKTDRMHPFAPSTPPGASHSVLVPLPDGRWLALTREDFDAAVIAGAQSMAASAHSSSAVVQEPLLDAPKAAEQLGISIRWLEDCARAGIIPHHKFGRFIRFRVSEVAAHCRVDGAVIS